MAYSKCSYLSWEVQFDTQVFRSPRSLCFLTTFFLRGPSLNRKKYQLSRDVHDSGFQAAAQRSHHSELSPAAHWQPSQHATYFSRHTFWETTWKLITVQLPDAYRCDRRAVGAGGVPLTGIIHVYTRTLSFERQRLKGWRISVSTSGTLTGTSRTMSVYK